MGAGYPAPKHRFRLTGNYLTFEIQREIAAECALDQFMDELVDE